MIRLRWKCREEVAARVVVGGIVLALYLMLAVEGMR